mmetsp:Transcript_98191/g.225347  ORF Transcript_98191/g.225347 Transcript_98191/m.225347 type:complete len:420 (+) Transcript_98191:660-1919(+)
MSSFNEQARIFKTSTDLSCRSLSSSSLLAWRRLYWKPVGKPCGIRLITREGAVDTSRGRRTRLRDTTIDKSDHLGDQRVEASRIPQQEQLQPHQTAGSEDRKTRVQVEVPKASSLRADAEGFVPQSRLSATAAPFCPGGDPGCAEDVAMFQEGQIAASETVHQEVSPEFMVCEEQMASFGEVPQAEETYTYTEADPAWWYEYQWNGEGTGTQPECVGFPMEELNVWEYIDPKGKVHGKFSCLDMRAWFERGYFPADLRVKYFDEMEFVSISSVYPPPEVPFASFPAGVATEEQKDEGTVTSDRDASGDPGRPRKGKGLPKAGSKGASPAEALTFKGSGKSSVSRHSKASQKGKGGKEGFLGNRKDKGKSWGKGSQSASSGRAAPPGDWSGQGLPWQGKEANPADRAPKIAKRQWVVKVS